MARLRMTPAKRACHDCGATFRPNNMQHIRCQTCRTNGPTALIRQRARSMVAAAIRAGQIVNLKAAHVACVDCGARATVYEHRDYSRPLAVDPTCRSCDKRRGPGVISGVTTDDAEAA